MSEAQQDPATSRLDNFVDAAFAFALTLLVIAAAEPGFSYADLLDAMRRIPVFAAGFALIGMFWFAHVSWRRAGGRNDGLSIVLSLMLVFTVLVYVYPMRLMVSAFLGFLTGTGPPAGISPQGLFTIYGIGFGAMAGLVWGLFTNGRRRGHIAAGYSVAPLVWGTVAAAGFASAALAQFRATALFAPWTYMLLPVAIPAVVALHERRRARRAEAG